MRAQVLWPRLATGSANLGLPLTTVPLFAQQSLNPACAVLSLLSETIGYLYPLRQALQATFWSFKDLLDPRQVGKVIYPEVVAVVPARGA